MGSGEPWFAQVIRRNEDRNDDTQFTGKRDASITREAFVTRRRDRLSEWAHIGALVNGATVCEEVLQDFEAVTLAEDDAELTLSESAA